MLVTGIVSSPRKGGNSELAVKEIFSQLPDDWDKHMIRINELNIDYCKACYGCLAEGAKCKIKDDLDFVIRHIKHADKVVIAAPAYLLGAHTAIKVLLDRLLSVAGDHRIFNNTDCVIVNSYGMPGWEGMVREETLLFARKFHLNVLAHEVMLATLPGDSVKGENLDKLTKLAQILMDPSQAATSAAGQTEAPTSSQAEPAQGGVYTSTQPDLLRCPYCSGTMLQVKPDGWCKCSVCGGEGKLISGPAGLKIDYDPDFIHRLTHEGLDIHTTYLEEKKQLFLDTRDQVKAIQAKYADMDWWVKP